MAKKSSIETSVSNCKAVPPHRDSLPRMKLPRFGRFVVALLLSSSLCASAGIAVESKLAEEVGAGTHFALAKLFADEGDFEQANGRFRSAVELEPDDATLRLEFAEFLMRFGRASEARTEISAARRLDPQNAAVLRVFGQIHLSGAERSPAGFEAAIDALEEMRRVDPSDLVGMVTLAQVYEQMRRWNDAADVVGELVAFQTDNQRLKQYWVALLQRAGRGEEAAEILRDLVEIENESAESRRRLAEAEVEQGNFSAAITILEGLTQSSSEPDVDDLISLAEAHIARSAAPGVSAEQSRSDLERAREIATSVPPEPQVGITARALALQGDQAAAIRVLEEAPEAAMTARNALLLAGLFEGSGRIADAAAALNRAVALAPGDGIGVQRQRALFQARNGQWEAVVQSTDELLSSAGPDEFPGLRAMRLEALVQLGRFDQALAILERDAGEGTPSGENLTARAEVLAASGRERAARRMLERVNEDDPSLLQRRAEVMLQLGDTAEAVSALERLVDVTGGSFEGMMLSGQLLTRDELFAEAEPFFRQAVERATAGEESNIDRAADAWFFLGQVEERQERIDAAARSFREVLELRPDDALALNYLGYMLADAGRELESALALIERAVELEPNNGSFQDSLGWAQYRLGRFEEAVEALERARELTPRNATILDHLGDAYLAVGDRASALEAYREAAQLADEATARGLRRKLDELSRDSD